MCVCVHFSAFFSLPRENYKWSVIYMSVYMGGKDARCMATQFHAPPVYYIYMYNCI